MYKVRGPRDSGLWHHAHEPSGSWVHVEPQSCRDIGGYVILILVRASMLKIKGFLRDYFRRHGFTVEVLDNKVEEFTRGILGPNVK